MKVRRIEAALLSKAPAKPVLLREPEDDDWRWAEILEKYWSWRLSGALEETRRILRKTISNEEKIGAVEAVVKGIRP